MSSDRPCDNHPDRDWHYGPKGKRLCVTCYVQDYAPISFVYHRDLPDWVKPRFESEEVGEWLQKIWAHDSNTPQVVVHVFSREEANTMVWHNRWHWRASEQKPALPYAYRAWADYYNARIILIVDETETPESIGWILLHELGHIMVKHNDYLESVLAIENKANGNPNAHLNDEEHEKCAEELFVNRLATAFVGQDLNRLWWRVRVNEFLAKPKAEETT